MTRRLKGVDRFSSPKRSTLCSKVLSEDEAEACLLHAPPIVVSGAAVGQEFNDALERMRDPTVIGGKRGQ
jgi:hypothetical protein